MNYLERKMFRQFICGTLTAAALSVVVHSHMTVIASSIEIIKSVDEIVEIVEVDDQYEPIIPSFEDENISPLFVEDLLYLPGDLLRHDPFSSMIVEEEANIVQLSEEDIVVEEIIEEPEIEEIIISEEEKWTSVVYEEYPYTKYVDVNSILNVRIEPVTGRDNVIGGLCYGDPVTVLGYNSYYPEWACIEYNNKEAYVHSDYLVDEDQINFSKVRSRSTMETSWDGEKLNKTNGKIQGPSGNETYYNLPMKKVVYYMNLLGYDYEVWTRDDGVKMFGDYVMVAANLEIRPKGSLVETSLGMGIVVDTGDFVNWDPTGLDIAVTW